jgi:diguanylate cyclase (GGDEF)-like protein
MMIESVMSRTVLTAAPDASFSDICKLMKEHNTGSVVILDRDRPVGIISERDVVITIASRGVSALDLKAHHVMKSPLITLPPATTLARAAKIMRDRKIRRLPVVKSGRLAGIVTSGDVLRGIQLELGSSRQETNVLKQAVYRDGLTGVFNQKYFKAAMSMALAHMQKYGGFLSLIMIDVDHFKQINDIYGHSAGDMVLKRVAGILRDNTGQVNAVCRFGGDEFAVISAIGDLERAVERAERFRKIVEETKFAYDRHVLTVTLSIGVAAWRKNMMHATALINAADKALYISKKNGRNRVSVARE